jgi:hypothetical protein
MRIIFFIFFLGGCTTREQVQADIFKLERVPESICNQSPQLWDYGIFRVVLCKNKPEAIPCKDGAETFEEFIPYCDKASQDYLGMHQDDANKWLSKLTRPEE